MVETIVAKPKKLKQRRLSKRIRGLAKIGQISPNQLKKLRGSQIAMAAPRGSDIPSGTPRGGVGKGMAGA